MIRFNKEVEIRRLEHSNIKFEKDVENFRL